MPMVKGASSITNEISNKPETIKPLPSGDLQPGVTDPRERRIQRSGVWQAVASNPALIGYAAGIEDLATVVNSLAEAGLKWVNEA
jgi:hypothetical protein